MEDSRNMFALFEHNNTIDKAVESRVLVADVLAKFERYVLLSVTCYIQRWNGTSTVLKYNSEVLKYYYYSVPQLHSV